MDIEIVEDNKDIISMIELATWMNEPCVKELTSVTNKSFIKDKETYLDNKKLLNNALLGIVNKAYEQGYYKGLRGKGERNEQEITNKWDSSKVYPKNGFTIAD